MAASRSDIKPVLEIDVGQKIGQCRAVPVRLGHGAPRAFLAAICADFDVDPYTEMFFFPSDTLKLICFDEQGRVLWRKELSRGVVPGMWFCPVLPLDLDGDGVDEIYFVDNIDPRHPLAHSSYCLTQLDARTGVERGQWPWPTHGRQGSLSHAFRNFLAGGYVGERAVLICAQGTYADMHLQAYDAGMKPRWNHDITADAPGARGSHMCPVFDINNDGNDEIMWGERCIELASGRELFCADRDSYRGHTDLLAPVLDRETGRWYVITNRESDAGATPRVVLFDEEGNRVWGAVEQGHMDMGWAATWDDGRKITMSIRIGHKTCGPDGRFHTGMTEFVFDAFTGEPIELPFAVYQTLPVDLNGDGMHELVRGIPGGDGAILDRQGNKIGNVGGTVAIAAKLLDRPGEHLLTYHEDGTLRIFADLAAHDSDAARIRHNSRAYHSLLRHMSTGWHTAALGGL